MPVTARGRNCETLCRTEPSGSSGGHSPGGEEPDQSSSCWAASRLITERSSRVVMSPVTV